MEDSAEDEVWQSIERLLPAEKGPLGPGHHPNLVDLPLPWEDLGVPGDRPTVDARAVVASD